MPDSVTLYCSKFSPGIGRKPNQLVLRYCPICVEMSEGSWKLPLTNLFSFCVTYSAWSL